MKPPTGVTALQTTSQEVLVTVDRAGADALHVQLASQLRSAIREGRLHSGQRLPASRQLASELGVARSVVVEAFAQLIAEGWLVARQGAGTRVASAPVTGPSRAPASTLPAGRAPRYDLRPGRPDPSLFPRRAWAAALAAVVRDAGPVELGYPDPAGPAAAREALAASLGRSGGWSRRRMTSWSARA